MKILIVCQYYYPENFIIYKISEELVKLGNDVTVLTAKPNYGYEKIVPGYENISYEEINGVKVHRVNIYPRKKNRLSIIKNYLSFWKNSKKWVRKTKEEFDVVYSMSLSPVTILAAGNLYKKKHQVRHIVHCVDLWPESVLITKAVRKNSLTYRFLYSWSKRLYSKADEILIGSPSYEEYFRNVLKITNTKLTFVPQSSLVEENDGLRKNLGEGFHILYCGNLGLIQNINLIPESMKLVKNHFIKFHVIGMGPKTEELKTLIHKYHLENRVIYHGAMSAKKSAPYFKAADVSFISLKEEGYVGNTIPNKLMMSMAFAKPILGVLKGDGRQVILDSHCGIIAKEDPKDIANKINELYELKEKDLIEFGRNAREYYLNHFSIKSTSEKINEILKN